uniref:Ribonuclease P/MRP protein subunit POP5 n=1 Tax=Guillardia theta TaxID=55529 RepID=A0A7S4P3A7_GUITH|mmetsp:Transcript_4240/g.15589  ORF Transcript_4240/g.15589 Transcript_4240/m.15589 type:complete len:146 (+) Transcript_4240:167-604(+)
MVRLKSRYLIVEMIWSSTNQDCACPSGVSKGVVMQAVKDSVLRNFGDVGMARLQNRMQIKYFNPLANIFIIRSNRAWHSMLWNAIFFIRHIKDHDVCCMVHRSVAMPRSCHKEALPIIQAKHKATRALTKIKVEEKVSRVQPRPK